MRARGLAPTLLLVLLALLVAGCSDAPGEAPSDGGGPGAPADDPHAGHDAATHLLSPAWAIGDYWTMESAQGGQFTYAISSAIGDDWILDTDSRTTAHFDARSDISFLGKVRKSDLAGSQGVTRVEFLRFPLQPGMEWTTTWDGEPKAIAVTDVSQGRATLEARHGDGRLYAAYTYDSGPGYFTRFAFYAPDGESVGFEWALASSGRAYSGTLVRWTLDELHAQTGAIPTGAAGTTFTVPAGFTDVAIEVALDCTAGAIVVAVGPPTGPAEDRGYTAEGPCPLAESVTESIQAPAQPEQWGALVTSAPVATTGTLDLWVFGRTAVEFKAGQAPEAAA